MSSQRIILHREGGVMHRKWTKSVQNDLDDGRPDRVQGLLSAHRSRAAVGFQALDRQGCVT
jgi:hypothetical protein